MKKFVIPENKIPSKIIRKIFKHYSYNQLKIIMPIWKFFRINYSNNWTSDWRLIVKDILMDKRNIDESENNIYGFNQNVFKKMTLLGKCPKDINVHKDWLNRPSLTTVFAFFASTKQLEWLRFNGLDFLEEKNNNDFLYASIISKNIDNLTWGLKIGMRDLCPKGIPLMIHAMMRSNVNNCPMVECLLSYNISWYNKGVNNESASSIAEQLIEWKIWKSHYQIDKVLNNLNIEKNKDGEGKKRLF